MARLITLLSVGHVFIRDCWALSNLSHEMFTILTFHSNVPGSIDAGRVNQCSLCRQ